MPVSRFEVTIAPGAKVTVHPEVVRFATGLKHRVESSTT